MFTRQVPFLQALVAIVNLVYFGGQSCSSVPRPAPDSQTAVYCDRVRNVPGLANYVTKNIKDRRKVEMPPQEWNGRRCRFVWRSRGFLTKSKDRLWQEQRAEWYPQPVALAVMSDDGNASDGGLTDIDNLAPPRTACWLEK